MDSHLSQRVYPSGECLQLAFLADALSVKLREDLAYRQGSECMGRMRKAAKQVLQVVVPERYIAWRRSGKNGTLYLTFDDGPDPEYTPQILDLLDAISTKATFFLVGAKAEANKGLVRDIVARGHSIGNHSYSHRLLPQLTPADYATEIDQTQRILGEISGSHVTMFRPPKGLVSPGTLRYLLRRRFQVVLWSLDSMDYKRNSDDAVVRTVQTARLRGGDIVLMHDDNEFTLKALPSIVEHVRSTGLDLGRL